MNNKILEIDKKMKNDFWKNTEELLNAENMAYFKISAIISTINLYFLALVTTGEYFDIFISKCSFNGNMFNIEISIYPENLKEKFILKYSAKRFKK